MSDHSPPVACHSQAAVDACVGWSALTFDAQAYSQHVAEFGLDDMQQAELLSAVWEIVVAFVDLGFDPNRGLAMLCESGSDNLLEPNSAAVLASTDIQQDECETTAPTRRDGRGAGKVDS